MILHVELGVLTDTAGPLREAAAVAREVDSLRGAPVMQPAGFGSEPVRRAAEAFLQRWAEGLRAVGDRAGSLATALETATAEYAEAEERMRRGAAAAMDGGPA